MSHDNQTPTPPNVLTSFDTVSATIHHITKCLNVGKTLITITSISVDAPHHIVSGGVGLLMVNNEKVEIHFTSDYGTIVWYCGQKYEVPDHVPHKCIFAVHIATFINELVAPPSFNVAFTGIDKEQLNHLVQSVQDYNKYPTPSKLAYSIETLDK